MPRPIWKGAITFGMISIPVKLFGATESKDLAFNNLHKECKSRLKQKRWCPKCEREVPNTDIVKGFEFEKGRYVIVDEEDIEKARVEQDTERRRGRQVRADGQLDYDDSLVPGQIVASVKELLAPSSAALYQWHPGSNGFIALASWYRDRAPTGVVVPHGMGTIGRAVAVRGPITTADFNNDPHIVMTDELKAKFAEVPYRAALGVPLIARPLLRRARPGRCPRTAPPGRQPGRDARSGGSRTRGRPPGSR